jgi:hypothetical protein
MKKLALTIALSALASTAYAGGAKTSILHCGCNIDGTDMVYKEISVSKKSKGHRNHVATSTDACVSGYDVENNPLYTDFVRTGDDCTLAGELTGLIACSAFDTPPAADDSCGAQLVQ